VRRRALALACGAAGWGTLTVALATTIAPAATGCATHQCDASSLEWTTGDWIDDNTWETNDVTGRWIPYEGNATLTITWANADGRPTPKTSRVPYAVDPYVGVEEDGGDNPNQDDLDAGSNFISAAGSLVEYLTWNMNRVVVLNSTCAKYNARFVIHFPPLQSDTGAAASAH
jgi:hypothetical protein